MSFSLGLRDSQQILLVVDQDGTVVEASGPTAAIWGPGPNDIIGRKCYRLMNGRTRDGRFRCSPACSWLATTRHGAASGPTEVDADPSRGSVHALEFRLTHVGLAGPGQPLLVHLLEERRDSLRRERIGARLDALRAGDRSAASSLTVREFEVFRLMSEGHNSVQIAAQLGVKPATVRSHTYRIFGKLGARSRAGALMRFLADEHENHL